jgi:hypothetical protein
LVKGYVQQKLLPFQNLTFAPFKLDSDQYGEARERGASAFAKESNLLLESDPD